MVAAAILITATGATAESTTHLFDPTLSLTGNCETSNGSTGDPVPDPGECPGSPGVDHPLEGRFNVPKGVAVDAYGDLYVINGAGGLDTVDIFSPSGLFITEINEAAVGESLDSPSAIAVDSGGHLYLVTNPTGERRVVRYDPAEYEPVLGNIKYKDPATPVVTGLGAFNFGIAVDLSEVPSHKDRLFVDLENHINEYKSAAEGNGLVSDAIGQDILHLSSFVTIDPATHDIYASHNSSTLAHDGLPSEIKVFDGDAPGTPLLMTIGGSGDGGKACPPNGKFGSPGTSGGYISPAVDASTGHLFVYDTRAATKAVYEFSGDGSECISRIERGFFTGFPPPAMAVDNGIHSPNSGFDPDRSSGYFFIPSGANQAESHVWAFEPADLPPPPVIEELVAIGITATGAELKANINPKGADTIYKLEYEVEGSGVPVLAKEGSIPADTIGVEVSAPLAGLAPGTTYVLRAFAENACETKPQSECNDKRKISITTYSTPGPLSPCPNDALREALGLSAGLPDCRAYELVTPPDTGGKAPTDVGSGITTGNLFATLTARADGGALAFMTLNGSLAGTEAGGGVNGSPYVTNRDLVSGWSSESIGPSGAQSSISVPGGLSPDFQYSVSQAEGAAASGSGSLVVGGNTSSYIRYPDGSFHLIGEGIEETDVNAHARYISAGGSHIIFTSESHLLEDSPPKGVRAVYDRSSEGPPVLISTLPGGGTPSATVTIPPGVFTSAEGNAVAFKLAPSNTSPLYLHIGGETLEATSAPETTFAGLSADGRYLFYVSATGDLFRFDSEEETSEPVAETGDAVPVNVASSGSAAFFVSQTEIPGSGQNPAGDEALGGEENLYRWSEGGGTEFIGTVTERDVEGESSGGNGLRGGLGLWTLVLEKGNSLSRDPSRTTADGGAFLFESRADLTAYQAGGKAEIYRYDASEKTLACLSCNPTGSAAEGDASLLSLQPSFASGEPLSPQALVANLSADGKRAFFQSKDRLLIGDTNHSQDVYEWEEAGTGSCSSKGGCLYLISSGQSSNDDYLYGASESGDDVFIWTTQRLLDRDADETPSIYDARVEGGFAEPKEVVCEGEGCRPGLTPAPAMPTQEKIPSNNPACPKGKRRVVREGGSICVKKHHHRKKHHKHKHHHKHHNTRRAAK